MPPLSRLDVYRISYYKRRQSRTLDLRVFGQVSQQCLQDIHTQKQSYSYSIEPTLSVIKPNLQADNHQHVFPLRLKINSAP